MVTAKKPASKKAPAKKAPKKAAIKRTVTASAKKLVAKKATAKKAASSKTPRTPNAAFMKALKPSAELAAVVGAAPLPRTEVTSKIWAYIKKNKLQDAQNKRLIVADDKLKQIFGKPQADMFEMTKLIQKHLS